ncbi:MAG: SufD family Fe-S cluster assembly protein [bacterium]|nr:SufD family Fe-S cluster assembly protein [bacterium]
MVKNLLFLDTIPDRVIHLDKAEDVLIVGLITTGWSGTRHLVIDARARKAKCQCLLFILGKDKSTFFATIEAIHRAPKTGITAHIRSALTDNSACNIEANWKVEEAAHGADTYFSHHTVLLSEQATAKTAPNLEIKTNDVKAGHSASVGKVDEDALFYLLSRGINDADARAMLVQGFFETELAQIEDESVAGPIRVAINNFLSK